MRREQAAHGPEHRRGEAAEERDLRDGAARLGSAQARERGERGVVEREPHRETERDPRAVVERHAVRERERDARDGGERRAHGHHPGAAMAIDPAPGERGGESHHQQRRGKPAVHHGLRPAQVGHHRGAEYADEVVGDAPADELRDAEGDDGAGADQGARILARARAAARARGARHVAHSWRPGSAPARRAPRAASPSPSRHWRRPCAAAASVPPSATRGPGPRTGRARAEPRA